SNDDPPIYIIAGSKASIPSQDLFHHHAHSLTIQTHAIAAGLPEVKANISYLNIDTSKGESANEFLARYLMEVPDEDEQIVLSTSNEDIIDQLSIYPNPTVSELFIQSNLDSPDYQIYDQKGLVVSTGSGKKVDVSTIPAGVYFLKVEARVFRFLKE
ncbi:MAG: T9SS type A sorting domain-containing protein, partial [Bacteroidota bacterium]